MAQTVAHPRQIADPSLEHTRLFGELLPVDARTAVRTEHRRELVEREPRESAERDEREPFEHAGVEGAPEPAPARRGDEPDFLVVAQRRRGDARGTRDFGDIQRSRA